MHRQPMTTDQIEDLFGCDDDCHCKNERRSCAEDRTCSTRCPNCGERIWFFGSWCDAEVPDTFNCLRCNEQMHKA